MKKILTVIAFLFFATNMLSADMLSEILYFRYNRIQAYNYGNKIGCSDVIVDSVLSVYEEWYAEGRRAARKDLALLDVFRNYSGYKTGMDAARATGEKTGAVVNERYSEIFRQACERGFSHGYFSIYNPNLGF